MTNPRLYRGREDDGATKTLPMPDKLVREMVADWMGAGRAITGKWEVGKWYEANAPQDHPARRCARAGRTSARRQRKERVEMTAANTHECFSEFIGQKVVGVLFNALPVSRKDIAAGTKTLVFEDGRGLTIASNGSYWIDRAQEVLHAVDARERELRTTEAELVGLLALAGARGREAPDDE